MSHMFSTEMYLFLGCYYSLHNKLFNLPARETCANGIFTSPPYQDNFVQGLDQRLKLIGSVGFEMYSCT
jgi:hypothetical protein